MSKMKSGEVVAALVCVVIRDKDGGTVTRSYKQGGGIKLEEQPFSDGKAFTMVVNAQEAASWQPPTDEFLADAKALLDGKYKTCDK